MGDTCVAMGGLDRARWQARRVSTAPSAPAVPGLDDVPALARAWSDVVLRDVPPRYRDDPQYESAGSVLRRGASEEELVRAEQRIGRGLPPSYRAFLAVSDGAYAHDQG